MNNFEAIIGIEIHIELNTKTKMFSSGKNDFNSSPNTNVTPVDIAYPGTLPVVNKEAVIKAIKLGKSLKMKIDDTLHFDRKNYFYPDLPKGFQITQQNRPIGSKGTIKLSTGNISIERIHLEEDTAKSIHKNGKTYINYNRAGVPLIEVVSDPVLKTGEEAAEYVKNIRDLARALDISDAKMEEGSLRADVNISVRPIGQKSLGTKVEVKNLNSIANIKKAADIEFKKQIKDLLNNKEILMATKRFDESKQDTVTMRVKTGNVDYKFFPEPNIPPIYIGNELINSIVIPELPWESRKRYLTEGLSQEQIEKLMSNRDYAIYFDSIEFNDRAQLAKIFFAEIVALSNSQNKTLEELKINKEEITNVLSKMSSGEISGKHLKEIIPLLSGGKMTTNDIIEQRGMKQISDEKILNEMLDSIIKVNKTFINENKERRERVSKFILGQLMKESKGQANPVIANKLVNKKMEV